MAKICARFVTHLFACPELPPQQPHSNAPSPRLDIFISYALHRTRLHESVTYAALYLLQRLKARFPAARGSSGHRLFISAFMLASKVICDDTYSNKSWSIVGQGMFALREINQMEREMCSYLEWQLNVEPKMLSEFEAKVKRDFKGTGPYPNYALPSPAPSPMPSTTPYTTTTTTTMNNAPSFVTGRALSTSPPKPTPRPPSGPFDCARCSRARATRAALPHTALIAREPPTLPSHRVRTRHRPHRPRRLRPQPGSKTTTRRSRPLAVPSPCPSSHTSRARTNRDPGRRHHSPRHHHNRHNPRGEENPNCSRLLFRSTGRVYSLIIWIVSEED